MQSNKVIIDDELYSSKKDLSKYIEKFKSSIENKDRFLITNDSINCLGWLDAFRFFLEGWQNYSSPIKDLVLSSTYKINKSCPLALPLYFSVMAGHKVDLDSSSKRVSSKDLIKELQTLDDKFIDENIDALVEGLNTAGATGTVSISAGHNSRLVEVENGFRTLCRLDDLFTPHLASQQIRGCKFVIYSGSIIEISEIHHILQEAYDTKQRVVLICSSISRDVANTLLVNWQKGSVCVIPFTIEDGLETLNEIKDISTVIGEIPISKENGLRLSSVKLSEKAGHDISFDSGKQRLNILLNESSMSNASKLKSKISEALAKEEVEDVQNLLRSRISKLSGRRVLVSLTEVKSTEGLVQDKASAFFMYFAKCAQQGIVDMGKESYVRYLPFLEAQKAVKAAESDLRSINSIQAIVELDT